MARVIEWTPWGRVPMTGWKSTDEVKDIYIERFLRNGGEHGYPCLIEKDTQR